MDAKSKKTQKYDRLDGLYFFLVFINTSPAKISKNCLKNESRTTHAEKRDTEVVAIWFPVECYCAR